MSDYDNEHEQQNDTDLSPQARAYLRQKRQQAHRYVTDEGQFRDPREID